MDRRDSGRGEMRVSAIQLLLSIRGDADWTRQSAAAASGRNHRQGATCSPRSEIWMVWDRLNGLRREGVRRRKQRKSKRWKRRAATTVTRRAATNSELQLAEPR